MELDDASPSGSSAPGGIARSCPRIRCAWNSRSPGNFSAEVRNGPCSCQNALPDCGVEVVISLEVTMRSHFGNLTMPSSRP